MRRALLVTLAAFVLAFAALYPYLEATGSCGESGCPHFSQAHAPASGEMPVGLFGAILTTLTLAGRIPHRFAPDRKPAEIYLSPEPEPPRL